MTKWKRTWQAALVILVAAPAIGGAAFGVLSALTDIAKAVEGTSPLDLRHIFGPIFGGAIFGPLFGFIPALLCGIWLLPRVYWGGRFGKLEAVVVASAAIAILAVPSFTSSYYDWKRDLTTFVTPPHGPSGGFPGMPTLLSFLVCAVVAAIAVQHILFGRHDDLPIDTNLQNV